MNVTSQGQENSNREHGHWSHSAVPWIPQQPLFTVREAAEIFKVHSRTVERWIEEGRLVAIVLPGGKSLRLTYQEVSKICGQTATSGDISSF